MWSCRSLCVFSRHLMVKVRCSRHDIRCFARCLVAPHTRKAYKRGRVAEFSERSCLAAVQREDIGNLHMGLDSIHKLSTVRLPHKPSFEDGSHTHTKFNPSPLGEYAPQHVREVGSEPMHLDQNEDDITDALAGYHSFTDC